MRWALAAALIVVAILAINGFPHGTDWPYELTRVAEMRIAYGEGQFPPYWAPDLYHGFGSPIFLFYAPLFASIASPFTLLLEVPDAAVATLCLSILAAALIMWSAVKEIAGPRAGAVAAIAFVLHPYVLTDIWIRNANAEVMALALLPGVIAGAISPRPERRFWWTFLSLTGVILAHNLTALVAVVMLFAIAALVRRGLQSSVVGALAAVAVTAFYWVPALALKSTGVSDAALLAGKFDFHNQFPGPRALLDFGGGLLGLLMIAVMFTGAFALRDRVLRAMAIAAIVLVILMLHVSASLWEIVPLMRYLQFPWRLAGPLAVVTVIGFAIVAATRIERLRVFELMFLALALINAAPLIRAYPRIERTAMRRFTALLTPEGIRDHGLRATVGDDYLPSDAEPRMMRSGREPVAVSSPGMQVRVFGQGTIVASSETGGAIAFRRWFFPGVWRATIDRANVPVLKTIGGTAGVKVPPGEHEIEFATGEPPIRTITKIVSALSVVAIVALAALRRRHFVRTTRSAEEPAAP